FDGVAYWRWPAGLARLWFVLRRVCGACLTAASAMRVSRHWSRSLADAPIFRGRWTFAGRRQAGRCLFRWHTNKRPALDGRAVRDEAPGDDLLSHGLSHTTIGAAAFHFRVRDGNGWYHSAMVARNKGGGCSKVRIG